MENTPPIEEFARILPPSAMCALARESVAQEVMGKGGLFIVLRRYDKRGSDWYTGIVRGLAKRIRCRVGIVEAADREGIDFGKKCPLGVFVYSVPVKDVRAVLRTFGAERVPVIAFPQTRSKCSDCVSVRLDSKGIAGKAVKRFDSCECASVAWVGAHALCEKTASDAIADALAAVAKKRKLAFAEFERPVYEGLVMRSAERNRLAEWLVSLPKPCGVLAWTDLLAKEVLDACREDPKRLKAGKMVFTMGIGNDELVCDFVNPPLASIDLGVEQAGEAAVRAMERLLTGRGRLREVVCRARQMAERDSASDENSKSVVVAQALKFIDERARKDRKFSQHDIARHLGISTRKLQLCFKAADRKGRTILEAIQDAKLKEVCRMLSRTCKSIKTIAVAAGFGSVSRLKAIFHERYGMCMRDWRQKNRKCAR